MSDMESIRLDNCRASGRLSKRRIYQQVDNRIIKFVENFNDDGDIIEFLRDIANNNVMDN